MTQLLPSTIEELEKIKRESFKNGYDVGYKARLYDLRGMTFSPDKGLISRIHAGADVLDGMTTRQACYALRVAYDGKYGASVKELRRAFKELGWKQVMMYSPSVKHTAKCWKPGVDGGAI